MAAPPLPTIEFLTRRDCAACTEARSTLQQVLEDRALAGEPIARVRYVDLADRPDLEADYGAFVPVLIAGSQRLQLSSSYRAIARFVDAALGRVA